MADAPAQHPGGDEPQASTAAGSDRASDEQGRFGQQYPQPPYPPQGNGRSRWNPAHVRENGS